MFRGYFAELSGNESVSEVLVKGGIDYEVTKEPLYRKTASGVELVSSAYATVNSKNNEVLGVVRKNYTPLQNREALEVFQPLVESHQLAWASAGSLRNGAVVVVQCHINGDTIQEVVHDDPVAMFATITNGHDGKLAVRFGFTVIRIWCENTLRMAHQDNRSKLIRVRHHKEVRKSLEELRDVMNLATQDFTATIDQYRTLARRQINGQDLRQYVKVLFGVEKQEMEEISTRKKNQMEEVERLFIMGRGNDLPSVRGTWWAAYNAYTEFLSHVQGRNHDNRIESNMFGQNAKLNDSALNYALQLSA